MGKIKLNVLLVPNVFMCCCLSHSLIISGHDENIQRLLQILGLEIIEDNVQRNAATTDVKVQVGLKGHGRFGEEHQRQLEIYIVVQ